MAKKCSRILKMEIKWFRKAAGFLLLFLMPVFSFIAFETITGNLQWIWEEREFLQLGGGEVGIVPLSTADWRL